MMASQPLLFHKWACLRSHQSLDERLKADDVACKMRKMKEEIKRIKQPKLSSRNVALQFKKGLIEKFPNEKAFVTETVEETKK